MTEEQVKIDALLQTAASRLLQASASVNRMRVAFLSWNVSESKEAALSLATHMEVVESTLSDSWRLMEIQNVALAALDARSGGLVN